MLPLLRLVSRRSYVPTSHLSLACLPQHRGQKTSTTSAGGGGAKEGALQELYMRAVEPPPKVLPKPTPEELSTWGPLSKLYVKLMWRRERVRSRDWHRKAQLKWAALHALPTPELRREALGVGAPVPLGLFLPQTTPPSTGFHGPEEAARERARQELAARERAREEDTRARLGLLSGEIAATGRRAKAAAATSAPAPKAGGIFGSTRGKRRFEEEDNLGDEEGAAEKK